MTYSSKKTKISLAISAALFTTAGFAAEKVKEPSKKIDEEVIEVIEVTGFKGSLRKALNDKRFSEGVTDSIHAEDIGKSTDQNIADALSRVTGVTVQEDGGEGTRISVRGAGASLNQISINGVALTSGLSGDPESAGADQSVDLSNFSSDVLSSISVHKTYSVDLDEGSLGANVILKTAKPLSIKEPRRQIEVQGRYNDYSEQGDRKLSFSFADKYFDEKLGFIITAADETQNSRTDRARTTWDDRTRELLDRTASDTDGKILRILPEGTLAEDLPNYNADTDRILGDEYWTLSRNRASYDLITKDTKRVTISAGLQYSPGENTDIQLDLNHSTREDFRDQHSIIVATRADRPLNLFDPNHEWRTLDVDNRTFVKETGRVPSGNLSRSYGDQKVENNIATFTLEHYLTDDLSFEFIAGYSKTKDNTPSRRGISTATWKTASESILQQTPIEDLDKVGYDCTLGACQITTGTQDTQYDPVSQTSTYLTSRFNPFDLYGNHVGNIQLTQNENTDTNKSIFLNFDWDVDFAGITKIEFGGKFANRVKDVSTNTQKIENGIGVRASDEGDGFVDLQAGGLETIKLADIVSSDSFPVDNFMDSILPMSDSAYREGWYVLDADKALGEIFGKDPSVLGLIDVPTGTRNIETESQALYGKINFEFFDGRLTGNFGLRYVNDKNTATGYSSVEYTSSNGIQDPHDLIFNRQVANFSLPKCDAPDFSEWENSSRQFLPGNYYLAGSEKHENNAKCFDFQLTHGTVSNKADTIPLFTTYGEHEYLEGWSPDVFDGSPAAWAANIAKAQEDESVIMLYNYADPNNPTLVRSVGYPSIITSRDGTNTYALNTGRARGNWAMRGWLDRSTNAFNAAGVPASDASKRFTSVTDTNSYSLLLPAINLNYAISEDIIGRFAASKTIARPTFDGLNPGLRINESIWSPTGSGSLGSTQLRPLESKNVDLSLEWYFNKSGLASIAFFNKDMKNFQEKVKTPYYWKDIRTDYDVAEISKPETLLAPDSNLTPMNSECMVDRYVNDQGILDDYIPVCHELVITEERNGKGAYSRGVEVSYNQNYDFLPGVLSGLGLSFNYTYSESESEPELVSTTNKFLKSLPQPHTPKHSSNTTIYWEEDGLMLRLAHRYNSDQMVDRGGVNGAIWKDASSRLDFSSSYKVNDNVFLTFQATNLTDDNNRTYFTSTDNHIGTDVNGESINWDEGNALDGDATTSRTVSEYKTGRLYRIGLRMKF
ncbi:TonB-dependent receptor domain-containing protein [Pseudocolwellia agarivorans]|uniref:TonB-dependent receptor domain-containing protein n=1 Tax=Pseudocolwellia agarivorans TaxID=1911682 RepID=UPI0009867CD7|nr:TonB-dependent receptor [Pseudocolwellia agarivorans]